MIFGFSGRRRLTGAAWSACETAGPCASLAKGFALCAAIAGLLTGHPGAVCAAASATPSPGAVETTGALQALLNPLLAQYDGGRITLNDLEVYSREMPVGQRIPLARSTGEWRQYMCGELAQMTALTSQAMTLGMHLDPSYLRARDYFFNEYHSYQVLRDHIENRTDLSPQAQTREYETHKSDFWLSATVTLRMIRTRDADGISSAAQALAAGTPFEQVEEKFSQVSPRYRGKIIGPFPSAENKTGIPPPPQVVSAAIALDEGKTTGPFELSGFHYIIKTEKKTEGRQLSQVEVAEKLEERLRTQQAETLVPALVDRVQKELGVVVDETLFTSANPSANDLLATVGALRITRQEYDDLNGAVRGPATTIANGMPTKLKRFVLPYMLGEWAKSNGYRDREETGRAIYYYDMQHLASRVAMDIGMEVLPVPTDEELRARFKNNIAEFRRPGAPEPRFEDHKDDMLNAIMQTRAPEADKRVRALVLGKINFRMMPRPASRNITALEAVIAAADKLTTGVRLVEVTELSASSGPSPYIGWGRAPGWVIKVKGDDGTTTDIAQSGPAPMLTSAADYQNIPAVAPWVNLWRFDTDSLKRHGVDVALGDFMAKYHDQVHLSSRVEFVYDKDEPTSPTDCQIVYSAVPVDNSVQDGVILRYSANTGDVVKRQFGVRENVSSPHNAQPAVRLNEKPTSASAGTTESLSIQGGS